LLALIETAVGTESALRGVGAAIATATAIAAAATTTLARATTVVSPYGGAPGECFAAWCVRTAQSVHRARIVAAAHAQAKRQPCAHWIHGETGRRQQPRLLRGGLTPWAT